MNCPKCDSPEFDPTVACPNCQFQGDSAQLVNLDHLNWLLAEMKNWDATMRVGAVTQKYQSQKERLEVDLGLRLPPFSQSEAETAWVELFQREALQTQLQAWQSDDWLHFNSWQAFRSAQADQIQQLKDRLAHHQRPPRPQEKTFQLAVLNFMVGALTAWEQPDLFVSPMQRRMALNSLQGKIDTLELALGLRLPPALAEESKIEKTPEPQPAPRTTPRPQPPKQSLKEWLWRSLLSERTLQAILFLGIFLLFSAAISFVVWGWKDFSALIRVAIPTGFTGLFFFLGWLARTKTNLYRSGIALSAIAALLIPIDLYTVYANYGSPPTYWAQFWLTASLISLGWYCFSTLRIQSAFFGYLVAVAAGSTVLATLELLHQGRGLPRPYYSAGVSGLALGFILFSGWLDRIRWPDGKVLIGPFRFLALLTPAVLMPLTFGWRYLGQAGYDALHIAVTINWWVGGLIFAWGALKYRSRALFAIAAGSLPVAIYLTQAVIFDHLAINPAWQALGLAVLAPLYSYAGYRLRQNPADPVQAAQGQLINRWGAAIFIFAALWSLTDLTDGLAAAVTHLILAGVLIETAVLWRRAFDLYGASLFLFSASTFFMPQLGLSIPQFGVGWASLALAHVLIGLRIRPGFSRPVIYAGYIIAAISVVPAFFPYERGRLLYTLGNWIVLSAWGVSLAHRKLGGFSRVAPKFAALLNWAAALPLPFWVWIQFEQRRAVDASFFGGLAVLSWGLILLSYRLAAIRKSYRLPWYITGYLVSFFTPILTHFHIFGSLIFGISLLSAGMLYFVDAFFSRRSRILFLAGTVAAWGGSAILGWFDVPFEIHYFGLALMFAAYIVLGLAVERRRSTIYTAKFLFPLYLIGHFLAEIVAVWAVARIIDATLGSLSWPAALKVWSAAAFFVLGLAYGLFAWGRNQSRWGYLGIGFVTVGFGILAILWRTGSGRSAVVAALVAFGYIAAERGIRMVSKSAAAPRHIRLRARIAWRIYRMPLLVAGWAVSVGTIGLALLRNLILLEGGRQQQIWAVVSLWIVTGLYAAAAWWFRRRRFVGLAAGLSFIPWTILTNLGWLTPYRLTEFGFAVSWMILAAVLGLISVGVEQRIARRFALPLRWVFNLLVPFSLLWGAADGETSRYTFGLAIGLYGFWAWYGYRQIRLGQVAPAVGRAAKYLYPVFGLLPIWGLYWLNWGLPTAKAVWYGLFLLGFAALEAASGRWLERISPLADHRKFYALPAYLTALACLFIGNLLVVAHPVLLALTLLYAALFLLVFWRIFAHAVWLFPAALAAALALFLATAEYGIEFDRRGWWLIGLAAGYLLLGRLLQRLRRKADALAVLLAAYLLTLMGLLASSLDSISAAWGYGAVAGLYLISAFWFSQPLFLYPTSALVLVPYGVALSRSPLAPDFYGLALFPGVLAALISAWFLDRKFGAWDHFPWQRPLRWPGAIFRRVLHWWALPLFILGYGLAILSPLFTAGNQALTAFTLLLLLYPLSWAIRRFRLRIWLVAALLAGHLSLGFYLADLGWWRFPADAFIWFMPAPLVSIFLGLWVAKRRAESPPWHWKTLLSGWSRPFYGFALVDIFLAQAFSLSDNRAGLWISLIHAFIFLVLGYLWQRSSLTYLAAGLGALSLGQYLNWQATPVEMGVFGFALLACGYGFIGFGVEFGQKLRFQTRPGTDGKPPFDVFRHPFQFSSLLISIFVLLTTLIAGFDLAAWTVRAVLGFPFRQIVSFDTVIMFVRVFALVGLLYLGTAVVKRRTRLGYLAGFLLLSGWLTYSFYILAWEQLGLLKAYALPAGLYLLTMAFFEWQFGSKRLGRNLDYLGLTLLLGSLFWQTLILGWQFALLLGFEGFVSLWWGSGRRLRRFFYAGIAAVVLATVGQLVNALQAINQWVTFGIIGLLLVAVALVVERRLDHFKRWQESLDDWE